ncbi:hypothetical protein INT44_008720 [Umbelopsis vinacea]|uniref:Choice-of-anchor A domain-containing protein n=1 Tax=Umbelopsis vinacea TaxID=44442 RepID=A0A8H7PGC8_9FUNG|nr:hypothetical protein INT44_008720 [Umbelopsis vinacea]
MLKVTSIVLALCLLQYAQGDDFVNVPFRNCHVTSNQAFWERFREDSNALSCVARTQVEDLNYGLPFCECTYDGKGTITSLLGFNAIVFGDFTTFGGQDILGRLAVQGDLYAPNYVVNANTEPKCYAQNTVPWDQLALAVGGNVFSTDTEVHGHWWAGGSGAPIELNEGCHSPAAVDTPFPFSGVLSDLLAINERLATQTTDLFLSETGELTYNEDISTNCYHVMTLAPCQRDPLICLLLDKLSSPKAILFGIGNWNGPNQQYPQDGKTVIINVPVFNGETFEISTNQPSQGANSCKLIWNFYPVDESGNYLSTGRFTILRHSGSPFSGVTIAPLGDIIDGSSSVFEGAFYAKSYIWEHQNGVEIHDTPPCDYYHFCLPDVTTTDTGPVREPTPAPSTFVVPPATSTTTQSTTTSSDAETITTTTVSTTTTTASTTTTTASTTTTTVSTTTAPAPESTDDATGYYTHTHHIHDHHDHDHDYDHDHGHNWHDKDDDKDWHKKDDDKDWHKKDDDKDHGKDHDKDHDKDYHKGHD